MLTVLLYKRNSKGLGLFFKYKDCKWIHEKNYTPCTVFIIYKCKVKTSLNYCTCIFFTKIVYMYHIYIYVCVNIYIYKTNFSAH